MKMTSYAVLMLLLSLCSSAATASSSLKAKQASKHPSSGGVLDNPSPLSLAVDPQQAACLEECRLRSQMASVGIEVIMEGCQRKCDIDRALKMAKSKDHDKKIEGIKTLCDLADRSTVPTLIALLQQDMEERTGIWATIIPALGSMRDSRAVPILIDLVNLPDDDWLGREMGVVALGEIGDHSATPALIRAAWRVETRDAAIIALARFNDERSIPLLVSAIQPEEEQEVTQAAMAALLKFGASATPAIAGEFNNFSSENLQTKKRVWLCDLLGRSGDSEALKVLQESRKGRDPAVRQCAEKYFEKKQ